MAIKKNKKQKMYVLGLNGFPKTNTTTTSPWPSPSKDNTLAVNPEREEKRGVITLTATDITHGFDSMGGFIKDKHSAMNTKQALYKSRGLRKQTRKTWNDKRNWWTVRVKRLLSWLTIPASQSEGVPPGRTVPVVVCCPLQCNKKHL